jgi:uncharacterized membrane protein YphA (DoxX/SURF4 family)
VRTAVGIEVVAARLLLGAVLAASVSGKLRHPVVFARRLTQYEMVPRRLAGVAAGAVTATEAALAVCNLIGASPRLTAVGTLTALMTFVAAVSWQLLREKPVSCLCFSVTESDPIGFRTLARLWALTVCAVLTWARPIVFRGGLSEWAEAVAVAAVATATYEVLSSAGAAVSLIRARPARTFAMATADRSR